MPRDAAATRARLIAAGRTLFAGTGVHATSLKAIVDAAGQRNASALHYHFGDRLGLLAAILETTNRGIEERRKVILDALDGPSLAPGRAGGPSIEELIDAWIDPQMPELDDAAGREFFVVVSQLADLFDDWDDEGSPPQARRCLAAISERLVHVADPAVRHERMTRFLEMTAEALGSRARQMQRGAVRLGHAAWMANLKAMCSGALQAR